MNATNLKQIIRSLIRRKYYTSLNIIGLGIGLGCSLLMAMYIVQEYSMDKFRDNSNNIYSVIDGNDISTCYAMGEEFRELVPEIENLFRMDVKSDIEIKQGNEYVKEENLIFADNTIIDMLGLNMLIGENDKQIKEKESIMISQLFAGKYFPKENPVGKTLELAISQKLYQLKITGVFNNFPYNSSIQTNLIANIENSFSNGMDLGYRLGMSSEQMIIDYHSDWGQKNLNTFIALNSKADIIDIAKKCTDICNQHRESKNEKGISFQPISQIYLHSKDLNGSFYFASDILDSLKIFMGIGLLILIVAIINFILISNADNNAYINEIACRKVNGANQKQIAMQQLLKSVLVAFSSVIPALFFIWLVIPVFNRLFDKNLDFSLIFHWQYISVLIFITLFTGLMAGSYLSLSTSKANPVNLFQNRGTKNGQQKNFKGALVVIQFMVFIFLSICFYTMYRQFQYALNKDLGIKTDNIISFSIGNDDLMKQFDAIQYEVKKNPHVRDCRSSSFTTPPNPNIISYSAAGNNIEAIMLGKGVIELLGIEILDGQSISTLENETYGNKIMINQAAAKEYGLTPGSIFVNWEVLGIVKDFNIGSLHRAIDPVIIQLQDKNLEYLLVKTDGNIKDVVKEVRNICSGFVPDFYVDFELLDDRVARFYEKEEKQMGSIGFFAAIAMGLSLLGLLGFVALNLVMRTKEMGVRKINGANMGNLIAMMNRQYILWIGIAFIIISPVGYLVMQHWLTQFAYHIKMNWWIFGLVGITAVGLAMITVSLLSWRNAGRNPVEALRYE